MRRDSWLRKSSLYCHPRADNRKQDIIPVLEFEKSVQKFWFPRCEILVNHSDMILHYFVLLYLSTWSQALGSPNVTYDDVKSVGRGCPELDSCNYLRSTGSRELPSPNERNCACDYQCAEFGDCCVDASVHKNYQPRHSPESWDCYWLRQFGGVYMKHGCAPDFRGSSELKNLCEYSVEPENFTDPLGFMPATDALTGVTYKNYYCAACNNGSNNLVLWTPRLECSTLALYNSTRRNLTEDYIYSNLVFEGSHWGLYLDGDNGSLFFHDCVIDPVMPTLLENKIRLCKSQLISECASDWNDIDVKDKCGAYMGIRYLHSNRYRNIHCALCNHVNVSYLSCQSAEYREVFFRSFQAHAFSLLLDINENKGQEVGYIQKCDAGEVFDPFFKKCRSLSCLPGHTRQGNQCVQKNPVRVTTPSPSPPDTVAPVTRFTVSGTKLTEKVTEWTFPTDIDSVNFTESVYPVTDLNDFSTDPATDVDIGATEVTSYNISEIDSLDSDLQKLKNCLLISLAVEEYVIFGNKSIYVPKYDKVYEPTNYFSNDGSMLVCTHLYHQHEEKFIPFMGYVTVAGLGISMTCLLLHFIVFCIVPDLQNLSGKNLISQCFSLFCAYCCFILGQLDDLSYVSCTAIAFLTFFFFQVSFFWMSTMAFDVWRTLRMATTELRVSSGKQWKRFASYSLYSWTTPLIIVAIAALAEYTDLIPEPYRPGFAQPRCWFKHRRALLIFFASPLIGIMIANIILFISSARMIILTTKTTMKQQSQSQKRNFKLYLRLALLMGLTWTLGLVAGYADIDFLWYLFIISNTLQGLFIFVSFSCTSKVFNSIKDRFVSVTKTAEYRSSTVHSGSGTNSSVLHSSNVKKSSSKLLQTVSKYAATPTNSSSSTTTRLDAAYY